jgi:hypothetical protein
MAGRRNTITTDHYPDLKRRFEANETSAGIARVYGVDHTTILYHWRKMALVRPRAPRVPRAEKPPRERHTQCSVPGCERKHQAKGYCHTHYVYYRNRGLLGKQRYISSQPVLPATFKCDHKGSYCDCPNPGKSYHEYLRAAGIKKPRGGGFTRPPTKKKGVVILDDDDFLVD